MKRTKGVRTKLCDRFVKSQYLPHVESSSVVGVLGSFRHGSVNFGWERNCAITVWGEWWGLADEVCLSTKLPTTGVCESKLNIKIMPACPGVQPGYSVCTYWIFPAVCVCGGDPVGTRRYLLFGWGLVARMGGGSIMGSVCEGGGRGGELNRTSLFHSTCDFSQATFQATYTLMWIHMKHDSIHINTLRLFTCRFLVNTSIINKKTVKSLLPLLL